MTKCSAAWAAPAACSPRSISAFRPISSRIAKGIASGMPLARTVARAEVMNWPPGAHASTFGGNPVSIAAALTTIELLEESLIENAASMGAYMMDRMRDWPRRFPLCGRRSRPWFDDRLRTRARPARRRSARPTARPPGNDGVRARPADSGLRTEQHPALPAAGH